MPDRITFFIRDGSESEWLEHESHAANISYREIYRIANIDPQEIRLFCDGEPLARMDRSMSVNGRVFDVLKLNK